jgi:hypothetical protein
LSGLKNPLPINFTNSYTNYLHDFYLSLTTNKLSIKIRVCNFRYFLFEFYYNQVKMNINNMIMCGLEDRSVEHIKKIESRFEGDQLMIRLFTKHHVYEGSMPLSKCTNEPIHKFKQCLENIECMDVKGNIDRLSFICYDILIELTNSKLVKFNQLQQ